MRHHEEASAGQDQRPEAAAGQESREGKGVAVAKHYPQPKITVDTTLCVGCGVCADECGNGVFRLNPDTQQAEVTDSPCIHCGGECQTFCRAGAVRIVLPR